MSRAFKFEPATRTALPLVLGVVGPSGSGKTFSALRLATGIAKVNGGKIAVIDTESCRAKWYADDFDFLHCDMKPPFGPLEYLAAVQQSQQAGAGIVMIDSMSHEHEGPGGVLEMHDKIAQDLAERWKTGIDQVTFAAWAKPKQERRRFINTILQLPISVIMCFRAKEKIKMPSKGEKKPIDLGWQPIGGEDIFFELGACFLLRPGAEGMPSYSAEQDAERAVIKTPKAFRPFLTPPRVLDERLGEEMAMWASGASVGAPEASHEPPMDMTQRKGGDPGSFIAGYKIAESTSDIELIDISVKALSFSGADMARIKVARTDAINRIKVAK